MDSFFFLPGGKGVAKRVSGLDSWSDGSMVGTREGSEGSAVLACLARAGVEGFGCPEGCDAELAAGPLGRGDGG